jgi:hypothetical protein
MEEKEIYEKPEVTVIIFRLEDSIATSAGGEANGIWLEEIFGGQ